MFHKLGFALSLLILICTIQSCSSGGDTITTTESDTTKNTAGYFSTMRASIGWVFGSTPMILFSIDSAGHSLSKLPGDTVWYLHDGRRSGVYRNTANWYDILQEVVDSGEYVFHFQRRVGSDTLSATFTVPVYPFHISAPAPGSHVIAGYVNDTIVYEPAGGKELWLEYMDYNQRPTMWLENSQPDNGKYVIIKEGNSNGYVKLLRHFVGDMSSPAPFKSIHYDYWESSKPLGLSF